MSYKSIKFENINNENIQNLIGVNDKNLEILSKMYGYDITFRDNEFKCFTDKDVTDLRKHLRALYSISSSNVIDETMIQSTFTNPGIEETYVNKVIGYTASGKPIKAKTSGQNELVNKINTNKIVFAKGPAGTGKTYLAVLLAVNELKANNIKKIILTRPAVEAGESLGFLPGDLKEKVDPYLTPLYDALYEFLGIEKTDALLEKGIIEIAPLAYMRGRTLNDAFIILDEAQNTTSSQMKMFLTRLGFNSKMVVCGDTSQIDITVRGNNNGLKEASTILKDIEDIEIVELKAADIVRNPLVSKIISKYETKEYYE